MQLSTSTFTGGISATEWYGYPVREYELIVMPDAKFLAMLTLPKCYLNLICKKRLGYWSAIKLVLVPPFIKPRQHAAMRTREHPQLGIRCNVGHKSRREEEINKADSRCFCRIWALLDVDLFSQTSMGLVKRTQFVPESRFSTVTGESKARRSCRFKP